MTQNKKSHDEREYEILCENVRMLLATRQGKDFVWHVLGLCNLYTSTFTGNSQTFYLEGKRDVGLDILKLLEDADPTIYPKLILDKQEITDE
jgi:hypothetical protein